MAEQDENWFTNAEGQAEVLGGVESGLVAVVISATEVTLRWSVLLADLEELIA
jgi:hypothetical protein